MHRDHQTSGRAAMDAVYPATRDYLSFIDLFQAGIMPWKVPEIWLFSFGALSNSDVLVNITGAPFEAKYQALLQHQSQYTNATDVYEGLQAIGSAVAAKNGYDPASTYMEGYQVVTIL